MAFTALGVSAGFACSINATVPATTGVAILVPLRLRYGNAGLDTVPLNRYADSDVYIVLSGLLNDSMPTPGATRFGFAAESINVGPRELNAAIVSSARSVVPMWLEAPTVITHGALPGAPMPPYTVWPAASRPL